MRQKRAVQIGILLVLACLAGLALWAGRDALGVREGPVASSTTKSAVLFADTALIVLSPAQMILVSVEASAVLDPQTGYYTYSYTLTSDPSSQNDVEAFTIAPIPPPLSIGSPLHWTAFRYHYQGADSAIVWAVTDVGSLPPGYIDTGNVPPSEFDLEPGQSVGGFTFTTPVPPLENAATFYAQGFDTLPRSGQSDEDPQPTIFEKGVSGVTLGTGNPVGIEGKSSRSAARLTAPRPNPSRGTVSLTYTLDADARVTLGIYDISGRKIASLVEGARPPGTHSVTWNGRDTSGQLVSPGVYFWKLFIDGRSAGERRVVLIRGS